MIRLTLRQFRTQAAVGFGALAVVAVTLAITGPHLLHIYDASAATCQANRGRGAVCANSVVNTYRLLQQLSIVLVIVPGIIGIFWGAPLVARELEAGTYRLAWTQSVSRARWFTVKLGVLGLASMAVAGLLSLMVSWWSSPIDRVNMNAFGSFDERDLVPIGYAALAFALGVASGVLIRRTLPAMATTLIAFVGTRLAMTIWIRPHLFTPVRLDLALNPISTGYGSYSSLFSSSGGDTLVPSPPSIPNAWITSTQIVDRAGHGLTAQLLKSACPRVGSGGATGAGDGGSHHTSEVPAAAQQVLQDCVAKVGKTFHVVVTYQPANRYWAFQWYELAIYVGAALVVSGFCFWWVRRRLT